MTENPKIELEIDENIPWHITPKDQEVINVLNIQIDEPKKEDFERIKNNCPTVDALRAHYYTMKTELNRILSNEATKLSETKAKDLTLRVEYYKEITVLFLTFLYGEYDNNMDRELPDEAKKKTEITQGEFMEFTDVVNQKYLNQLKEIYETEKYEYSKKGVSSELQLKILFTKYYKELFGPKNEVSEK